MNAWLSFVDSWLIDFACLSTVLLAAAVIMRLLLQDPGGRVMLAWGTWLAIGLGAVLIAAPVWPRYGLAPLYPKQPVVAVGIAPETDFQLVEPLIISELPDAVPSPADEEPVELFSGTSLVPADSRQRIGAQPWWPRLLVSAWLASAAASVAWIFAGFAQAWLLLKRSRCAPQWIGNELSDVAGIAGSLAEVRVSPDLSSAVALGALKPRILLPQASAVESNAKAVRAALAHEWAHIRHGDLWLLAIERLLLPLLAAHPLFWWLRWSTRLDQELLADAAAAGEQPVEYAEALVAWAKAPAGFHRGLAALAMWERPSNLSRRVQMILSNKQATSFWAWQLCGGLLACGIIFASAGLSTVSVRALEGDEEPAVGKVNSPAETPAAAEPAEKGSAATDPAAPKEAEMAITLKVALLVLDRGDIAENTRKQVIEAVERLTRGPMHEAYVPPAVKNGGRTLRAEIDNDLSADLALDIQSITGVKLVSRSKVITLDGHEAHIQLTEPGGSVTIEEAINGDEVRRVELFTELSHALRIKPRALGNGSMLNLDVHIFRKGPRGDQRSGEFKTGAQMGRTLVVVSSEPYALLVTPVKVEPQVVSQSAAAGNHELFDRDLQLPGVGRIVERITTRTVPAPPVRTAPVTAPFEAAPAVMRGGPGIQFPRADIVIPGFTLPFAASQPMGAVPATTSVPIAGPTLAPPPATVPGTTLPPASTLVPAATPAPVIPALPTTIMPQAGTSIPPLPGATAPATTPVLVGKNVVDGEREVVCTMPIDENASEFAGKLRQRLRDEGFDNVTVSSDAKTNSIVAECKVKELQKIANLLEQLGATFNNTSRARTLIYASGDVARQLSEPNVPSLSPPLKATNQTQRKLLELDLQEAQVNVEAAEVELAMVQEVLKKNPNSVSRQEVRKRQLEVDRAKIQMKRIQVQLEAEKAAADAAPASTPKPVVPGR